MLLYNTFMGKFAVKINVSDQNPKVVFHYIYYDEKFINLSDRLTAAHLICFSHISNLNFAIFLLDFYSGAAEGKRKI